MRIKTYIAQAISDWFENYCLYHGYHSSSEYWPCYGTRAWQVFGKMLNELAQAINPEEELKYFYHGNELDVWAWIAVNFCADYLTYNMNDAKEMRRKASWDMPFRQRHLTDFIGDFIDELDVYIENYEFEEAIDE